MVHAAASLVALAAVGLLLVFIGMIGAAFYATGRRGRLGRALAPAVRPVLRATWAGRLDDLRDRLAQGLRAPPRIGASPAGFHRPAVAIFVNTPQGALEATMLAILKREGRRGVCIEVRSGSPFRRPRRATCEEVLGLLESALRALPAIADLQRGR